jgi:import receptor subunit TOM70
MSQAAKDGNALTLSKKIEEVTSKADKAVLLYKRGVRYAYDGDFKKTTADIDAAYNIIENDDSIKSLMGSDDYIKILEWVGMCRHLRYDLKGADKCYRECTTLNPTNVELLVKRAGVKMDDGDKEQSLKLFEEALALDPSATDALLHRANLYMLQQNTTKAKEDLEECLKLQPNNLIARLRLATVYMTLQDLSNAKKHLDLAEQLDENSSEVHSYRGEMHFAMGEVKEAKMEFDKAIKADPFNPTPYVNAALAVMNTVPLPGTPPDVKGAISLFEKAIEVDPQFHAAYVQLGQLKLSAAHNLTEARSVISLYDEGINMCRTKEELKDICSMRILTVAQVDAASSLGMETLNMQ